jgi:hypothetical protein
MIRSAEAAGSGSPGKKFNITAEERRLDMEGAADDTLRMFRNSTLQPVRLTGEDEKTKQLASNPDVAVSSDQTTTIGLRPRRSENSADGADNLVVEFKR